MVAALCLYAVLDGADFGVGVWKFITALQSDRKQRQVIWEANHVWLIFVAIILFNGFPPAFVALNLALLMSLFLVLLGIVFRGADSVFHATMPIPRFCNGLPNLASTATPFFLSASVGRF